MSILSGEVNVGLIKQSGIAAPWRTETQRGTGGPESWRGGRLRSVDRLMVLLACDQQEVTRLRQAWLGQAIDLLWCGDLAIALARVGQSRPHVVVVGEAGGLLGPVDFLVALRQVDLDTPVIVGLGDARPELGTRVLAAGATAVVRWPFSPEVVLQLLDSNTSPDFRVRPMPIDLGRLRVDGSVTRIWVDGVESLIPAMEFLLLRYLAERHGEVVTRDDLLRAGWGEGHHVPSNSLNVHLARIRRRFPPEQGRGWLRSVRGTGYQLVVAPVGSESALAAAP